MSNKRFGGGLLAYTHWWNINCLSFADQDLDENEQIYRFPYAAFEKFMQTPLKNADGDYINTPNVKNKALRDAYTSLGKFLEKSD